MKKYGLFLLAVIFLTNTIAMTAWAKPCMTNPAPQPSAEMKMDCHKQMQEQGKKKQDRQHCEGICLCEHANLNQTPIIEQPSFLKAPLLSFERIEEKITALHTRSISPLRKPPRVHS